jgi:hypothetical protein
MGDGAGLYAGFLYGVNIPGGVWLKAGEVEAKLRRDLPALGYVKCVGDADNVLLEITIQTESEVASRLETLFGIKGAVVISLDSLRRAYDSARRSLKAHGFPDTAPFVVNRDEAEWEFGVVLSSVSIGASTGELSAAFRVTKNARALAVIERRVLLVQKRRATATGSRIMWGSTVIKPLQTHLHHAGLPIGCLTSRALARIGEVISAADDREAAG